MDHKFKELRTLCLVFLVGGLGGLTFYGIGAPLPWLIGPLFAVACLSLAGLEFEIASAFRQVSQLTVGCAVGLQFTRDVFSDVITLVPWMLFTAVILVLVGAGMSKILARFGKLEGSTAFFASMPGGVVEMAFMAERYGGDANIITVGQTVRVILTVLIIPTLIQVTHSGASLADAREGTEAADLLPATILLVGGYVLARRFVRIGIPNAWIMAGLLIGTSFSLSFNTPGLIPTFWVYAAQLAIGVTLGLKVQPNTLRTAGAALPFLVLNTFGLLAVSGVVAITLGYFTAPDFASLFLANAPAGVAEMSITAKVLMLDVPVVVAFHLVRILMVIVLSAWIFRLFWQNEPARNK